MVGPARSLQKGWQAVKLSRSLCDASDAGGHTDYLYARWTRFMILLKGNPRKTPWSRDLTVVALPVEWRLSVGSAQIGLAPGWPAAAPGFPPDLDPAAAKGRVLAGEIGQAACSSGLQ